MALSRTQKVRTLRYLNPLRLVRWMLVLGLVALAYHLTSFVLLFWDVKLPTWMIGFVFLSFLPLHVFRWWALGQGWSVVTTNEISLFNLEQQLGERLTDDDGNPVGSSLLFQKELTATVEKLGWVTWSDVMEAAQRAGYTVKQPVNPLFLGGSYPIARPTSWKKHLHAKAHRAGELDALWADAETPAVAKKARL